MTSRKVGFAFLALTLLSVVACGGDDGDDGGKGGGNLGGGSVCEQACAKIEDCSPGSVCTINNGGSCDGKAAEVSQCILDKPCGETSACFF